MLIAPLGDEAGTPGSPGSPGKIVIESGAGGPMMTLSGGQNNDWFGYSVAVVPDLNFDGFKELLVGAPRHGTGRAYLFYGPFNDIGVEELTVADADYTFSSPHAGVFNFGAQVAPLHDVTNDDVHDLRIKSFFMNPQGQPVMRTYIYSGLTLELLTSIIGDAPFDPWAVIDGDTDNDADVDADDLNTVITNQGLAGNLTRFDGDLNGDGTVNGADLVIVTAALGSAHFAGHIGGGGGGGGWGGGGWSYSFECGSGDCYFYDCDCALVCAEDCEGGGCMSFLECNPPQCPGGGCAVYIEHEPEGTVQCVFEDMTLHAYGPPYDEGGYLWNFLTGASLVQMQGPTGGQTIHFRLKKLGKIKPKVYRNWCGGCEAQDLIISVWIDSDDDGLPDAIEDDLGTSPFDPDSDGDGVPDGQEDFDGDGLPNADEIALGFDPTDPDSDGDGTPDGQENPSEGDGGVAPPNCGSNQPDINLAWACGDPLDADAPITLCEDEAEECDCFTFHVDGGGGDDYWFVAGNPPGASIDGDPDQDRTSPCIDLDGPGSFEIGVISPVGGAFCMATQTINIVKVDLDIDSDNDGTIDSADDAIEDAAPGKFIVLNDDDDDYSGVADMADPQAVSSENDLVLIRLSVVPAASVEQWTLTYSEGQLKVWQTPTRTGFIPNTVPQTTPVPAQLYVEGIGVSSAAGDASITLDVTFADGGATCSDMVTATVLQAHMTAFRPDAPLFQLTEVPDAIEQLSLDPSVQAGAGVRFNGDNDNGNGVPDFTEAPVPNENDLVRLEISGDSRFILPATHEWVLRRSSPAVRAWRTPTKQQQEVFGGSNVGVIEFISYFVEWVDPSVTTTTIEIGAREITTGVVAVTDVVSLYRFQSVVIALGGEGQDPTDPPLQPNNYGVFVLAIELYQKGYDVRMYNEEAGVDDGDGSGPAYDEVVSAVQDRAVVSVGIFGYSHGGGAAYNLANGLSALPVPLNAAFTAYIDAVTQGGVSTENRRPTGTAFHANYYQHGILSGGPIAPPGANFELDVETTPWGAAADHFVIDDYPQVLTGIRQMLQTAAVP